MEESLLQDPGASAAAKANGGAKPNDDDELIAGLRKRIAARKVRADELKAELDTIAPELRRYERALSLLTGDAERPTGKVGKASPVRPVRSRLGEERLEKVRGAVLGYARDHEEFRQVDIRNVLGNRFSSSIMTSAFEQLRQENVIRFARQEGISKFYRLTRESVREA
jgi:hypothetical protein